MVKPFNMHDFGRRLARCRARTGLSQAALAALAGLKAPHLISNLERGVKVQVWAETVMRLAQVLDVSTDYLLGLVADDAEAPAPGAMPSGVQTVLLRPRRRGVMCGTGARRAAPEATRRAASMGQTATEETGDV